MILKVLLLLFMWIRAPNNMRRKTAQAYYKIIIFFTEWEGLFGDDVKN